MSLTVVVLLAGVAAAVGMQPPSRQPLAPQPLAAQPKSPSVSAKADPEAPPSRAPAVASKAARAPSADSCSQATASMADSSSALHAASPRASTTIGPADRWAVLIGIQDYAGNTHPTYGGRGDVAAIRTTLLHSGWLSDHILTLIDRQANCRAIRDAMSWLAERSSPLTFSLFHFSGHACIVSRGPCAAGHTYLWSYDNRFIPESTVGSALARVQGRAWFDFAACEAGAFDAGLSSPGRLVTASSQASETSYEEPGWNESVWSGLVWDQASQQGRAGGDPARATIGQMVEFGRVHAAQLTASQAAGPQHPYVAGGDPTQSLYAPHT